MPRIVLVDDDRSHMMSLSMMLEAEGFEVECHSDGLAAWESLSKSLPDILVALNKLSVFFIMVYGMRPWANN